MREHETTGASVPTEKPPALLIAIDEAGVASLTLNRPALHNAFDDALIGEIDAALAALADDARVRVVVLRAAGRSFSAGADLNWMKRAAGYGFDENVADARKLAAMLTRLDTLPKPTMALVQGAVFGGGVGLIACCDIALCAPRATFALSEVRLGLVPAVISPFVVAAMGARQARRYFQTAERFDAATALRVGLVHEVCDEALLNERAREIIGELLKGGPLALDAAKSLVRLVTSGTGDLGEETAQLIARLRGSDEGKEGLTAFLDKRSPSWINAGRSDEKGAA